MTEQAFHKDYLPLAETLYRVAFYMLESEAEAEDAVQEVFLKLWDARAQLDAVQSPKAYSIRLLKNLCLNRIRKARQLRFQPELPEADGVSRVVLLFDASGLPQDDTLDARQRLDKVLEGIKSLPERQREILILRSFEGCSYAEIARKTGMSPASARVQLARARKTLKTKQ